MVLELHVWGPAFSLPSIDPQCLAAIAYLASVSKQAESKLRWALIASNDASISPTNELPLLRDGSTLKAGLHDIIDYLLLEGLSQDLDDHISSLSGTADIVAFTSHILCRATPLLDLSLYVSSENYIHTTRPTYSRILPWPTQYIIPPSLRASAIARTQQLGLSSLDLDHDNKEPGSHNASFIPTPLRTAAANKYRKTSALVKDKGLTTRFRLDELVDVFCAPLAELLQRKPYLLSEERPSSLDCLATAYLALMLNPPVPHDWLAQGIRQRWKTLAAYTERMSEELWGGQSHTADLPWQDPPAQTLAGMSGRLASHALSSIPVPLPFLHRTPFSTNLPASPQETAKEESISPTPVPTPAHSLSTVLITATAAMGGLTALSTYLLYPYLTAAADLQSDSQQQQYSEKRRSLHEMGESGAMLAGLDFGSSG